MIDEILHYNRSFVSQGRFAPYQTSKYPDKHLAVLSCMDTRLTELLPAALGLRNGDVKLIKNAGAVVSHPFGSIMRSLLIAVYELGVEEIMVVGHYDCGVQHMDGEEMLRHMRARGISEDRIRLVERCGIDLRRWLTGFDRAEDSVRSTVEQIVSHPIMPDGLVVRGFLMDPATGRLDPVS